jgi:hypothetical protein
MDEEGGNVIDYQMEPNSYSIYRVYKGGPPSYTPDELHSLDYVSDASTFTSSPSSDDSRPWWSSFGSSLSNLNNSFFTPFLNATTFRLMKWFYNGSNLKSLGELD